MTLCFEGHVGGGKGLTCEELSPGDSAPSLGADVDGKEKSKTRRVESHPCMYTKSNTLTQIQPNTLHTSKVN